MILPKHILSEPHNTNYISKLNWLRAAVLGANDGIVSIAGLVVGVAGANNSIHLILTAGMAGVIAGAISMAAGEYVSVSSSRDTERALLDKERKELRYQPKQELAELTEIYRKKGLSQKTAKQVAKELTNHDPIAAHFDAELGIDPNNLTNPMHAALASAGSFLLGALFPLIIIILPPPEIRIQFTFISVIVALAITGYFSARVGGANTNRAMVRVVIGGMLAMAITYSAGYLFGVNNL
jgi:VIT1/CCC1 family predicted Fe2+/Mn2+ transporter